ncbi:hypothetical protein M422DRAFT_250978 [Sphaerobolus stellatus SS14]|uniref:Unplaced genomic scaffold SPHSTscaffold_36, whole genome shotgun sequence n=1 Tax=Sphaerobolus stellatus (strain SS14) TaxID=990650 RepID=A0A0C9VT03_SPHS4|nr:hypothetical protein M422DRAFT_250978 [Sphaerobolus stellatus SS14]
MSVHKTFAVANAEYIKSFNQRNFQELPLPATSHRMLVSTLLSIWGYEGEAHVIRNAGGKASDALRSLIISQHLFETWEIAIFHYTGCGMLRFTDDGFQAQLKEKYLEHVKDIEVIDFLAFSDVDADVKKDVGFLKKRPLLADNSKITGWVYEVETGKVHQVD